MLALKDVVADVDGSESTAARGGSSKLADGTRGRTGFWGNGLVAVVRSGVEGFETTGRLLLEPFLVVMFCSLREAAWLEPPSSVGIDLIRRSRIAAELSIIVPFSMLGTHVDDSLRSRPPRVRVTWEVIIVGQSTCSITCLRETCKTKKSKVGMVNATATVRRGRSRKRVWHVIAEDSHSLQP